MTNAQKKYLSGTLRIEKQFIPLLAEAITAYRSSFIDHLPEGTQTALAHLPPVSDHIAPILQHLHRQAGHYGLKFTAWELAQHLTPLQRRLVGNRMKQTKAASLGIAEQWIEDVIAFLRLHLVQMVAYITDTMRQDIVNILEKATQEGWSIDRMVEQLRDTGLIEARARVIARTETIRAANIGHQVAASKYPFEVNKVWDAAQDHRTRHSHRDIHGHQTDEHGTFNVPVYKGNSIVGYEPMQRPGDPSASAGNTINCRCRAQFVPKTDAQGNLLMRRSATATIIPLNTPATQVPVHTIAAILKANAVVQVDFGKE